MGAFSDAMKGLGERGLTAPLKAAADRGAPILGICVGCQMLLSRSEEFGDHAGLDLIPGPVARLPEPRVKRCRRDSHTQCRLAPVNHR